MSSNAVCGHCRSSHAGGKNACIRNGVDRHVNGGNQWCQGCARERLRRGNVGARAPTVPTAGPVVAPTPAPALARPSNGNGRAESFEFRVVVSLAAGVGPTRVVLDRAHNTIARQYSRFGKVTFSSVVVSVMFAGAAAVSGYILTEFRNASEVSRTTSQMLEANAVSSDLTSRVGATETFGDRAGRPSRNPDSAGRQNGGDSLALWMFSAYTADVQVVLTIQAWGTAPLDLMQGRAVDYAPAIAPASTPPMWVQRDGTNARFATIRLAVGDRIDVTGGIIRYRAHAATSFVNLRLDGTDATATSYPGLAALANIIAASGVVRNTQMVMLIQ